MRCRAAQRDNTSLSPLFSTTAWKPNPQKHKRHPHEGCLLVVIPIAGLRVAKPAFSLSKSRISLRFSADSAA